MTTSRCWFPQIPSPMTWCQREHVYESGISERTIEKWDSQKTATSLKIICHAVTMEASWLQQLFQKQFPFEFQWNLAWPCCRHSVYICNICCSVGATLYRKLQPYLMTEEQLQEHGYPRTNPEAAGKAIIYNIPEKKATSDCECRRSLLPLYSTFNDIRRRRPVIF